MSASSPALIAHIVYCFSVGGLENGMVNLINRLPRDSYRHVIISLTKDLRINASSALEMAVDTGSYRIARHLLLNMSDVSLDLQELKKKCEDKDISKLLVRFI